MLSNTHEWGGCTICSHSTFLVTEVKICIQTYMLSFLLPYVAEILDRHARQLSHHVGTPFRSQAEHIKRAVSIGANLDLKKRKFSQAPPPADANPDPAGTEQAALFFGCSPNKKPLDPVDAPSVEDPVLPEEAEGK